MKLLRNALLASLLLLMWSIVFSSATVSIASAQQDEASQDQAPPPPDGQNQTYDKPDAGRPLETPDESANDSNQNESDRNDPPGRAARLQYMSGSVSIQPHGTDDWVQGSVNRPLTIADNVWADKNSRAELNVGTGLIRIGSESSLTLTNVNDNSVQLSLHQGAMNLHVRHLYRGEVYEVDTPNQAFTILKTGDYRFDVDPNADTTLVTVWRGEGEATGQGPSVRLKEHQQARFSSGNSLAHEIHSTPRPDGFDDWCQVRNRREDESVSARYVSPDVIGSEDLDAYGTWRTTPEYGSVWVPTVVQPGWAPYAYGHWIWEEPWGWTWVDDAPWGFAPFHYGRWVSFGGYWGWAPGPYYGGWGRGWYAPALVSWFGGPGWGVGFGFGFGGGFGWCPLGWGEPFRPWYHAGWGYFRNVNIYNTRITNINGFHNFYRNGSLRNGAGFHYANMNARGGFTAVSSGTLQHGLPVAHNAVRINANAVRTAPALSRPNVSPTLQSRLGPNAGRPVAAAPARAFSRPVISHMTPPAPSRTGSFNSARAGTNQPMGASSRTGIAPRMTGAQPNTSVGGASSARGSVSTSSAPNGGRYVPRPPQGFGGSNGAVRANNNLSANNSRGPTNATAAGQTVPRPTTAGGTPIRSQSVQTTNPGPSGRAYGNTSVGTRSVPRPPAGGAQSQLNSSANRSIATTQSPANRGASPAGPRSVPRPTGQVLSAPHNYSSGGNSGNYSSRYNGQSSGRYSAPQSTAPRYSGSPYGGRSYGASPYQGSRSAPSPSGRSYGGGSYGRSYSAPSHGSSPGSSSRSYGSSGGGGGSRGSSHSGGHR